MGHPDLDTIVNAPSWIEGIKKYRAAKSDASQVTLSERPPVVRKHEREAVFYNPITQKFKDERVEEYVQQKEREKVPALLNSAWDTQIAREAPFDIVNQRAKRGHKFEAPYVPQMKAPSMITATRLKYDLISALPFDEHHWAPPGKRPPPPSPPKPPRLNENARPRDFDIVSNKFKQRHEEKVLDETNQLKTKLVDKYWRTHKFDVVRCAYVDDSREEEYQRSVEERTRQQGAIAMARMPLSTQKSEGNMYDIATGVVKDPERLAAVEKKQQAQLAARAARIAFEDTVRYKNEHEPEFKEKRSNNRIAHERYAETVNRGYDILSTELYAKTGRNPPLPKTKARPRLQDHINAALIDTSNNNNNTTTMNKSLNNTTDSFRPVFNNNDTGDVAIQHGSAHSSRRSSANNSINFNNNQPQMETTRSRQSSRSLSQGSIRSGGFFETTL